MQMLNNVIDGNTTKTTTGSMAILKLTEIFPKNDRIILKVRYIYVIIKEIILRLT